ncbi:hypothetical protein FKM82_001839 [Ascaphus truei]
MSKELCRPNLLGSTSLSPSLGQQSLSACVSHSLCLSQSGSFSVSALNTYLFTQGVQPLINQISAAALSLTRLTLCRLESTLTALFQNLMVS